MHFNKIGSYIPYKFITVLFIIWSYSSYVPTVKNIGFYCDDESIKKPYSGDTIHILLLFTVLLGLFPLIIYLSEVLSRKSQNEDTMVQFKVRILLRKYYSGFLFVLAFVEILKFSYCEHRPHFFTTCEPDMKDIRCSDGLITDYNCTAPGVSIFLKSDMYKSFPSGHAALALYTFVFINVYLHAKVKRMFYSSAFHWWLWCIFVITLIWTIACCVTRILDNRHFWWDVLAGVFIGLIGGIITIRIALKEALERI